MLAGQLPSNLLISPFYQVIFSFYFWKKLSAEVLRISNIVWKVLESPWFFSKKKNRWQPWSQPDCSSMLHFNTPRKQREIFSFSEVFRRYRNATLLGINGIRKLLKPLTQGAYQENVCIILRYLITKDSLAFPRH